MTRLSSRRPGRSRSRAQAMVEFAMVAPLFFLTASAIIDCGRYVYSVQGLTNAAREGARYAIVAGGNSFQPAGPTSDDPSGAAVVRNHAVGVVGNSATLVIQSSWA